MFDFIKGIKPLSFDDGLLVEHIQCLADDEKKLPVIDEVDTLYEEIHEKKERFELLELIGNPNIIFDNEEEEMDDD